LILRQLSEGGEAAQSTTAASSWMIVVYVFAALFGLEILLFLLALGISLIVD
jgi:high-affinity Fe2+/Pb2+ permease